MDMVVVMMIIRAGSPADATDYNVAGGAHASWF